MCLVVMVINRPHPPSRVMSLLLFYVFHVRTVVHGEREVVWIDPS